LRARLRHLRHRGPVGCAGDRGSEEEERKRLKREGSGEFHAGRLCASLRRGNNISERIFLFTEVEVMANLDAQVAGESIIPAEIILEISLERGIYPN
jgi:hypothetical protein